MLACLLALLGVALDLILDALDLILETLDLILEALDIILETLDLILEALDLILEALGDILGMAWVLSWPGDPEWAGLHSGSSGSSVLIGSRDPGHGTSGG